MVGVFARFFRQLIPNNYKDRNTRSKTNRDKKRSQSIALKNFNSSSTATSSSSISSSQRVTKSTATIGTSYSQQQQSSREGKSFKYNEDGRRYYGIDEIAYILPNDDDETDRLHEQHWVLKSVLERNYHAPVTEMLEKGIAVLDTGCGPGTWDFEMAEVYPNSKFYGVDISYVFPETIRPANVDLVIGNITKCIPYPDNTFHYVHQRLLMAGLTNDDWEHVLEEIYRVLKPGGYVELAEFSIHDFVNMGQGWGKLQTVTMDAFQSKGIPPSISRELKDRLIRAGFVNEKLEIHPLPINHDGKRGELMWNDLKHAYLNMRPALEKCCVEWSDKKFYKEYIEFVGQESRRLKTCMNWYACYAQKPYN